MTSPYTDLERPPLRVRSLNRALVRDGSPWREVRVLAELASTNAAVAAEADSKEGLVVVAEHQTAGRGRLDRAWVSPPRAGLTFSVLLHPHPVPEARWTWLPLLVGLAMAEAVEDVSGVAVRLKWPNDLLADDRKLGGILIERHGSAVVVGIGINVTTTDLELPGPQATSLLLAEAAVTDRETLLRAALRALADRYLSWQERAGDSTLIADAYADRCATLGAHVRVALADGTDIEGTGARIDADGQLVVETASRAVTVTSGDVVQVRPG
jgi:BirA family transcriptional regulator, biotin operon repressor / biotin---[acetyl-CoA-carboxylase] ligase